MGNPPRISSWRSLFCSFFSFLFLLFCVSCGVIFNSVVKSIFSIISSAGFKKIKTQTWQYSSLENYYTSGRSTENWNFDLSAGNITGKLINLGFPRWKTNSKLDFRGKRQGFDGKKPNWNALWRNISRDILSKLVCEVRRTENCSLSR